MGQAWVAYGNHRCHSNALFRSSSKLYQPAFRVCKLLLSHNNRLLKCHNQGSCACNCAIHPTVITMQSFLLYHINYTRRHEPSVVLSVVGGRLNSNSLDGWITSNWNGEKIIPYGRGIRIDWIGLQKLKAECVRKTVSLITSHIKTKAI